MENKRVILLKGGTKMDFKAEYMRRLELDRKVTEEMVADGEITEEEGYFRNDIRRFEILEETEAFINSIELNSTKG